MAITQHTKTKDLWLRMEQPLLALGPNIIQNIIRKKCDLGPFIFCQNLR